jgi:uncharacterized membrane protein (UPF0182 family)
VQRNLLARFHVTEPNEYFSGQDFWQVPNVPDDPDSEVKQPPFYLNVQLPGQDGTRFQLTSAVTPNNRDNLAALISGSYVDNKPRLEILELPDQTAIQGPVQVHQRMTNNALVRSELTLLSNSNQSQVQFGNLISLPVGDGMLYVEPVYVKSGQQDAVPLLQKVLMSYGDGGTYVVLANNLKEGLDKLVAQGKSNQPTTTTPPAGTETPPAGSGQPVLTGQLAQAAADLDKAIADVKVAQQSGDFAKYGAALQALDVAMTNFQNAQKAAGVASPPTKGPVANPSANPSASASTPVPTASGG